MTKKPMVNLSRLEKLMKEKGWEVGDLVEHSRLSYNTIYSLFKGRRPNTSADTLRKLAAALGTSVDDLLVQDDEDKSPKQKLPEQVRQLAELARQLTEMRQEELLQIAALLGKLDRERLANQDVDGVERLLDSIERTWDKGVRDDFVKKILAKRRRVNRTS